VLGGRPGPGGDQQRAEFVAVQPDRVRLVIQPGPPDMGGREMIQEFFLDGISVESGDGTEPAGDGGPGPATGFKIPGEALDVGPAGLEQVQLMLVAPGGVLAQVQFAGLAGQAAVAG